MHVTKMAALGMRSPSVSHASRHLQTKRAPVVCTSDSFACPGSTQSSHRDATLQIKRFPTKLDRRLQVDLHRGLIRRLIFTLRQPSLEQVAPRTVERLH